MKRAQSLINTKSISTQSYDEYVYQYENASSQLESAKASLQNAQIQFDYTKIYAPIDGIIGLKKFDIGNLVGSNDSNTFTCNYHKYKSYLCRIFLTKMMQVDIYHKIKDKTTK